MRLFRYVAWIYLKYIFIIAFALSFLFAGLDYLQQASNLEGFNIKVLYIFYKGSYAFDLLFPITLVFAMIVAKVTLIRSNALLSFYALGYSKKQVLFPFMAVAFVLTLGYIAMHNTTFVDAEQLAKNLRQGKKRTDVTRDLFVKYNDSFIYIAQLIPERKEARDIRIYTKRSNEVTDVIYGKKAVFDGKRWIVKDARVVVKPTPDGLGSGGLVIQKVERVETLEGFKPRILTSVFEGKRYYTLQSAWEAYRLLGAQGLDTLKIRNLFYHMAVTPFFALFLVVIFFLAIPPYARSANLVFSAFVLTGTTLFVWGILFFLYRVARTGAIQPEAGTLPALLLLAGAALYGYLFRTDRL